jgi:ClpX C4-type zinc finger
MLTFLRRFFGKKREPNNSTDDVRCGFCGVPYKHVKQMIVNGPTSICDGCIDQCRLICRKLGRDDIEAEWEQMKEFAP